jgi:glycosyltransferase involved in cell wall biosynthesis
VTILLSTLKGERFLPEQLSSLERQTCKDWKLMASDDGSVYRTKSILHAFQKSFEPGKIEIVAGPRGAPEIFFSWRAREISTATFYAFCHQDDDVGELDSLARVSLSPT